MTALLHAIIGLAEEQGELVIHCLCGTEIYGCGEDAAMEAYRAHKRLESISIR